MNPKLYLLLLCVVTAAGVANGQIKTAGASDEVVRQRVMAIDRELDDAFAAGDRRTLERLLADNAVAFSSEGEVVATRSEILSQVGERPQGIKLSATQEDVKVFLYGDTAIVASKKIITAKSNQGTRSDSRREVNTFSLANGNWRLVSSQTSWGPPPYSARDVRLALSIDENVPIKRSGDATVVLIEFVDYQCPLCRKFSAEVFPRIDVDYIKTGRVAFAVRNLPVEEIHPLAFGAAKAAKCAAAQERFWEMDKLLISDPVRLAPSDLVQHAKTAGLDLTKFDQCVNDPQTTASVRGEMADAAKLGIAGTPIFLVGVRAANQRNVKAVRMIQGAYPYDVFKATLETTLTAQGR